MLMQHMNKIGGQLTLEVNMLLPGYKSLLGRVVLHIDFKMLVFTLVLSYVDNYLQILMEVK